MYVEGFSLSVPKGREERAKLGLKNMRKKFLAILLCFALLFVAVRVQVVYADPIIGEGQVFFVIIVFLATVTIEAFGIYFLLKAFGVVKERVPEFPRYTPRQCFILAFVLNLVTFFFGNYILLPLLSALSGS
jgi:NADH:ubiquinone oxidoreductase subunit K